MGQSAERFWGFPFYHYEPIPPGPSTLLEWFTDSDVQLGLDLLFWLSAPALAVLWLVRRRRTGVIRIPPSFDSVLFVMATVYYAATVVSFTNLGDNARYHTYELPLQYATILFIIVFALRFAAPAKSLAEPRVLNPSK